MPKTNHYPRLITVRLSDEDLKHLRVLSERWQTKRSGAIRRSIRQSVAALEQPCRSLQEREVQDE
jgi:predicted transcriptional regulator